MTLPRTATLLCPLVITLLTASVGCPPKRPLPLLPGRVQPDPVRRARPVGPSLSNELTAIGDRLEDCAVERNVSLARKYGGTPADVEAARKDAMRALATGVVRNWWRLRILKLPRPDIKRIHRCLDHRACTPFFECSKLSDLFDRISPRSRPRPTVPARR